MKALLLISLMLLFAGCYKRPTEAQIIDRHKTEIYQALGPVQIERAHAPAGPFHLAKPSHWYFKAYAPTNKETYYVDAYVSSWSVLTDGVPIYRYSYYRKTFGIWIRVRQ